MERMMYLFILILLGVGVYYLFVHDFSKPKIFPPHWHDILKKEVLFYQKLSPAQQSIFQKRMMLFYEEVHIQGVDVEVEELDQILIAASAIIPVFGFKEWHFNNLTGVYLFPNSFNEQIDYHPNSKNKRIRGMVGTGKWEGKMLLSQKALRHGFSNKTDKNNTAIHEFVHLIDKVDGKIDGVPEPLRLRNYTIPWLALMHKEMEAINNDESDIRKYGGTSQIEFFAVASEYFFERPELMRRKHPELYKMLKICFNVDGITIGE